MRRLNAAIATIRIKYVLLGMLTHTWNLTKPGFFLQIKKNMKK